MKNVIRKDKVKIKTIKKIYLHRKEKDVENAENNNKEEKEREEMKERRWWEEKDRIRVAREIINEKREKDRGESNALLRSKNVINILEKLRLERKDLKVSNE